METDTITTIDPDKIIPKTSPNPQSKTSEKDLENPFEKIEQLLTCPICLDRYKSPKILPCQHTFCLPCLDNYSDTVQRTLKCPECRAEHTIDPYEGIKTFPTNLTLSAFLDIHMEATEENAAQFEAYIQRYNLERCKICDEKAELKICAHCEKKTCDECRKTHMEMLKRDLARLLKQVKRLSSRVEESADGLGKGINLLILNVETTKSEIKEYFHRYSREMKKREDYLLNELEIFMETEKRLMQTLHEVLKVENGNLHDACIWVDSLLNGTSDAKDEEITRIKNVFVEGLDYLRNFQPDSDDLFAKKIRFSPGDDASKLPNAILNFGELTISLPQFANRYFPLEEQYLPKPFRMGLESDAFKSSKRELEEQRTTSRYGNKSSALEDGTTSRYKRRQQLEDEAWNRLKEGGNRCDSPLNNSPWNRVAIPPEFSSSNLLSEKTSTDTTKKIQKVELSNEQLNKKDELSAKKDDVEEIPNENIHEEKNQSSKVKKKEPPCKNFSRNSSPKNVENKGKEVVKAGKSKLQMRDRSTSNIPKKSNTSTDSSSKGVKQEAVGSSSSKTTTNSAVPKNGRAEESRAQQQNKNQQETQEQQAQQHETPMTHRKPPLPRQNSSQDDPLLNDKIETIRLAHEKRVKERFPTPPASNINNNAILSTNKTDIEAEEEEKRMEKVVSKKPCRQKFRILYRSLSSHPPLTQKVKSEGGGVASPHTPQENVFSTKKHVEEDGLRIIPIAHYPDNSTTHRYYPTNATPPPSTPPSTKESIAMDLQNGDIGTRRSRFRRRSSIVPDREMSSRRDESSSLSRPSAVTSARRLSRSSSATKRSIIPPAIDYISKQRPRLTFGRKGTYNAEFHWPRGIAVMPGGEFAVADSSNHRIQIFDKNGKMLRTFGKYGSGPGELDCGAAVAWNRYRQQLVVSDRYNHRIQIFDLDGKFILQFGSHGSANGRFNNPWGVALDELGLIYVVDKDNHRVQIFDQNGNFMNKFGSIGDGSNQFNHPLFIAIHKRSQNIFVSDSANHRICIFNHDCTPLMKIGSEGFHIGQLKLPRGIAVDEQGYLIVADSGNNRIQVFSPEGKFIRVFGAWGSAPGQMKGVEGVALLTTNDIVISDRENNRIQIF